MKNTICLTSWLAKSVLHCVYTAMVLKTQNNACHRSTESWTQSATASHHSLAPHTLACSSASESGDWEGVAPPSSEWARLKGASKTDGNRAEPLRALCLVAWAWERALYQGEGKWSGGAGGGGGDRGAYSFFNTCTHSDRQSTYNTADIASVHVLSYL